VRVHLKEKGHPILGDVQYGRHFRCQYQPQRQMLHALQIGFIHPLTGDRLSIQAPIPEDFLTTQKNLF
jgi:23S rRNA pseudouridine1911/1915/1917 synthase